MLCSTQDVARDSNSQHGIGTSVAHDILLRLWNQGNVLPGSVPCRQSWKSMCEEPNLVVTPGDEMHVKASHRRARTKIVVSSRQLICAPLVIMLPRSGTGCTRYSSCCTALLSASARWRRDCEVWFCPGRGVWLLHLLIWGGFDHDRCDWAGRSYKPRFGQSLSRIWISPAGS